MSDTPATPRPNPRANHRVAYFNGRFVPEREVVLPFRDRGFKYGDAAFDMTRTFHGRPFKLKEHVERLYRSLRYLRIDPGLSPGEMVAASEETLERITGSASGCRAASMRSATRAGNIPAPTSSSNASRCP
jgi:branched-subunit amino acid aminotransferase/4-amino-4-deoxychorismate lyase